MNSPTLTWLTSVPDRGDDDVGNRTAYPLDTRADIRGRRGNPRLRQVAFGGLASGIIAGGAAVPSLADRRHRAARSAAHPVSDRPLAWVACVAGARWAASPAGDLSRVFAVVSPLPQASLARSSWSPCLSRRISRAVWGGRPVRCGVSDAKIARRCFLVHPRIRVVGIFINRVERRRHPNGCQGLRAVELHARPRQTRNSRSPPS
jgi:hypothetical protein